MNKIGIYKITNPVGSIYVGASANIDQRLNTHYKYACNVKSQTKLYRSFVKYGIANHNFEIVELCNREILYEREVFWIAYFDSYISGLNSTHGGENPPKQNKPKTEEHKKKISIALKGKKHTEEAKQKIRDARHKQVFTPEQIRKATLKKIGVPSKLKGRKRPNISEKLKGKKSPISIKCELINKETGVLIKAESMQELSRISKISITSILKIRKGLIVKKYKNYEYKQ